VWINGIVLKESLRGWLGGRLSHGRVEIVPGCKGNILERTTSGFETKTDGWMEKCDDRRLAGGARLL
jgi:hypothetical protein